MARCFVTRQLPGSALERLRRRARRRGLARPAAAATGRAGGARGDRGRAADAPDRPDRRRTCSSARPHLRAIANYAVGYDNIDVDAATARGIAVGNTPDVLTDATADLAFALLMAAARRLPEAIADARDGDWLTWEPGRYLGAEVHGATLGIIGFGRIGRAVAQRAAGFEMTVVHAARAGEPRRGLARTRRTSSRSTAR